MELQDGWSTTIINAYNSGYSDVEVCKELNITPRQFQRALKDNSRFAELIEYGRMLAASWWSSQARAGLNDKTFNTPLYIMYMKNYHEWKDKVENVNIDAIDATSLEEMKRKLREDLPRYLEKITPKTLEIEDASEQPSGD